MRASLRVMAKSRPVPPKPCAPQALGVLADITCRRSGIKSLTPDMRNVGTH